MHIYNKILDLSKMHKKIADKIIKISKSKKSLADIGGGSGLLAYYLTSKFKNVTVIEPSIEMTNYIQDDKIKIINKSIQDLIKQKKKEKYETVLCFDSLHHFSSGIESDNLRSEIEKAIDELIKRAEKEVIIIEPSMRSLSGQWIKFEENYLLRLGCYFLYEEGFEEILEKYDYKLNYEYFNSFLIVHIIKK